MGNMNILQRLKFQEEAAEARKLREEKEEKLPKTTKVDVPKVYGDYLPFNDFQLFKEWDATLYSGQVPEPKPTDGEEERTEAQRLKLAKEKFERYVSE
jgi:hypothetical protein